MCVRIYMYVCIHYTYIYVLPEGGPLLYNVGKVQILSSYLKGTVEGVLPYDLAGGCEFLCQSLAVCDM